MVGGGSVSFHISQHHDVPVWVNDSYTPLTNFWEAVQEDSDALADEVKRWKEEVTDPKAHFKWCRQDPEDPAKFFYLNRMAFSGLTEAGGCSASNWDTHFTYNAIARLREAGTVVKDWKITNQDYTECLTDHEQAFIYLDPPYDIKANLYGKQGSIHKHFKHDWFKKTLTGVKSQVLVSYNAEVEWDGWSYDAFPLTYTMLSRGDYLQEQKKRNEGVLRNYA